MYQLEKKEKENKINVLYKKGNSITKTYQEKLIRQIIMQESGPKN